MPCSAHDQQSAVPVTAEDKRREGAQASGNYARVVHADGGGGCCLKEQKGVSQCRWRLLSNKVGHRQAVANEVSRATCTAKTRQHAGEAQRSKYSDAYGLVHHVHAEESIYSAPNHLQLQRSFPARCGPWHFSGKGTFFYAILPTYLALL